MSIEILNPCAYGLDLRWGVQEIGADIRRTPRQTHYLLSKGVLPARKIGGRWCASRDDLKAFFVTTSRGA